MREARRGPLRALGNLLTCRVVRFVHTVSRTATTLDIKKELQVTTTPLPSTLEHLTILESLDTRDVARLDDHVNEYNIARTGIDDARDLAIVLRDERGELMAGLYGWTWGECCEIRTLWVHEHWRGQGVGTRLMIAAEREARDRGATQIVLSTHSFQAPEFYRALGFEIVGQVDDYPIGHRSIYLRKWLR